MGDLFSGLESEAYDRQYKDIDLVRRIVKYFVPYKRAIGVVTATVLLTSVAETSIPIVVSAGINQLKTDNSIQLVIFLSGMYLLVATLGWLMNLYRRRASGRAIGDIVRDLRYDAFRSAISRDMSFYDQFNSGKVVTRITSDTQDFAGVIVLITDLISKIVMMFLLVGLLILTEWRLALIVILLSPSYFLIAMGFRRVARRTSREGNRMVSEVNNMISESVKGINVAKNFRQEQAIYTEFGAINQQAYHVNLRRGFAFSSIFPILHIAAAVMMAMLTYFGAQAVTSNMIPLGAWYLFIQSVWYIFDPLTGIASFWSQFQSGLAAAERVFALIDAPLAVVQKEEEAVTSIRGEIAFKGVRFAYNDKETVLPGLDLHIKQGETVAFVGHTGAGKSSIAKLVARFYEFQGGDLLIDGRDIRTMHLSQYRRHLGIVSQVPFLFAGTVADNIRYGRPEATDAEILTTIRKIGDGEWLETLADGLGTQVGERGVRLSMGQRQLVCLTRVLVQNPSIFILDEATASIDPFTETQIQEALNLILSKSTSILIAHRLSTVRSADRIVVLKRGAIIEQGNHEALIAQQGHYAELYNTYFRHQSLDYVENSRKLLNVSPSPGVLRAAGATGD